MIGPAPSSQTQALADQAAHHSRRLSLTKWNPQDHVSEILSGNLYEFPEEEDTPLNPRATLDVRSLEIIGGGRHLGGPLAFVEGDRFQLLVSAVVIVNIIIVARAYMVDQDSEDTEGVWLLEQVILTFYVFEIAVRMLHFGRHFFLDRWYFAIGNYIDLVVVVLGVLDTWVYAAHMHSGVLRSLRMVRLLRLLRWILILFYGDLYWVESDKFIFLVYSVIVLNSIVMGLETDYEHPCWWWFNQGFLVFFLFELIVRIKRRGFCQFWRGGEGVVWNYMDSIIIAGGIVDQWLMPLLRVVFPDSEMSHGPMAQTMMSLRMLRLTRVLRLLRLVKAIRPLYHLAVGIIRALQSMFWVLVLTMVALYAFALLSTNLIGKGMISGAQQLDPEARALFSDVPNSLFTLFGLMNNQFWQDILPVFAAIPAVKPAWVIFTIFSSWALLSVMTGVVSDNMLEVRHQQQKENEDQIAEMRDHLRSTLKEAFQSANKDLADSLEKHEYIEFLKSPYHIRKLQRLANVPVRDLLMMFDWIDIEQRGSVSYDDFMHGFDFLNEAVTSKSLLKLESTMRQRCCVLEKNILSLRAEMRIVESQRRKEAQGVKSALQKARGRYDEESSELRAKADAAENEARELRKEASRCWRAVERNAAEGRAKSRERGRRGSAGSGSDEGLASPASPASPASAASPPVAKAPPPAEPRTLAQIAARLRAISPAVSRRDKGGSRD